MSRARGSHYTTREAVPEGAVGCTTPRPPFIIGGWRGGAMGGFLPVIGGGIAGSGAAGGATVVGATVIGGDGITIAASPGSATGCGSMEFSPGFVSPLDAPSTLERDLVALLAVCASRSLVMPPFDSIAEVEHAAADAAASASANRKNEAVGSERPRSVEGFSG